MSITEIAEKCKQIQDKVKDESRTISIILILILTSSLSYGLGRMNSSINSNQGNGGMALVDCTQSPARLVGLLDQSEISVSQTAATGKVSETIRYSEGEEGKTIKKVRDGQVFASKKGKKYYYSWCSGGNRIKPANRVFFDNAALAEAAGYTIAASCK
jgi:hypothetical protein